MTTKGVLMQIDIKGRNVPVSDKLRRHAERRLGKVSRQVSPLARLELEISAERNPRVADSQVAEATLYLKGITLRARDASPDMMHSLNLVVEELSRQVKRHRDKRRKRREAHAAAAARTAPRSSPGLSAMG
ncbi:MAG TPA: ribosome-associated translation inhibitor RaiA [Solirubrobacteraceae bacterium]|jgi:putative sigma-54 modulation protein